LVSELGPNAFGEPVDPGRVDCYLGLPLPPEDEDDADAVGGVLVVAPRWLLHPAVPQPAGSLVYELATGHPDRQAGELVFPADLTEELRAWPTDSWAALGVDLEAVAAAVNGCWQRGDVRGLHLPLEPGEDPRALTRPAMTLARAELRERLGGLVAPRPAALAASHQRPPARRALPIAPAATARLPQGTRPFGSGVADRLAAPPPGPATPPPPRRQPPRGWMRRSWRSTAACCRPGNARRRSWPPGRAAPRSAPPWAPRSLSS
jgi:hypothetical protein